MPTVRVNDTQLHYERTGQGPAILLVHGMCGHAGVWAYQAGRLADRYTCVSYDRRGHSRSARGDAPITIAQHADDGAALIEALGLAPCLVVASSSGAVIAVDLARRYGHLLRGVVLGEPPLFSLDPDAGAAAMGEVTPTIEDALARGGLRAGVDAFMSIVCPPAWAVMGEDRRDLLRANTQIGFTDLKSPPLDISAADLTAVWVPALVIAGTVSHPALRSVAHRLAAALPDARLIEIDGGHVPHIEHSEDFVHAASAFAAELDQHTPAAAAQVRGGVHGMPTTGRPAVGVLAGMSSTEFHTCPEPGCSMPAEAVERFSLPSTDGPVEHLKTICARGHVLTPLAEMMPPIPSLVRSGSDLEARGGAS
jgi:3-oxoadipate enol-lactonase